MDFIFYSLINFQYYRIKRCFFIGNFDEDFFLYTILIQENISLHYLFIIKDIMMIRSKSHKII